MLRGRWAFLVWPLGREEGSELPALQTRWCDIVVSWADMALAAGRTGKASARLVGTHKCIFLLRELEATERMLFSSLAPAWAQGKG